MHLKKSNDFRTSLTVQNRLSVDDTICAFFRGFEFCAHHCLAQGGYKYDRRGGQSQGGVQFAATVQSVF